MPSMGSTDPVYETLTLIGRPSSVCAADALNSLKASFAQSFFSLEKMTSSSTFLGGGGAADGISVRAPASIPAPAATSGARRQPATPTAMANKRGSEQRSTPKTRTEHSARVDPCNARRTDPRGKAGPPKSLPSSRNFKVGGHGGHCQGQAT